MGLDGIAEKVSGAHFGTSGASAASRSRTAKHIIHVNSLILDSACALGNNEKGLCSLGNGSGCGILDATHGRTAVDHCVSVLNGNTELSEDLGNSHTNGNLNGVSLGEISADGYPLFGNGLTLVYCAPDVVNCFAIVNDNARGDGKITGLNYSAGSLVDLVDFITHRIDVGKKLNGYALSKGLSLVKSEHVSSVLLDCYVSVLDAGLGHNKLCTLSDLGHFLAHDHVIGIHEGLALCTVNNENFCAVGKLSVGGESCSARTNDAVVLHY